MFNEIDLKNCPEQFAFNCKKYETACHECLGNNTGKYLKYIPINKSIQNHPALTKQKNNKTKGVASYSKKGRIDELKIIHAKDYLTKTYASGSIAGDGDAKLNLQHMLPIPVEIKIRYTEKGSLAPTKAEIKEGITQNIKLWIVKNVVRKLNFQLYTFYYLDFNLFADIQRVIFLSPDIRVSTKYINKTTNTMCFTYKSSNFSLEHYISSYSTNNIYKKYKDPYHFKIKIIKNPLGQFVMMTDFVFDDIISLYKAALYNPIQIDSI